MTVAADTGTGVGVGTAVGVAVGGIGVGVLVGGTGVVVGGIGVGVVVGDTGVAVGGIGVGVVVGSTGVVFDAVWAPPHPVSSNMTSVKPNICHSSFVELAFCCSLCFSCLHRTMAALLHCTVRRRRGHVSVQRVPILFSHPWVNLDALLEA